MSVIVKLCLLLFLCAVGRRQRRDNSSGKPDHRALDLREIPPSASYETEKPSGTPAATHTASWTAVTAVGTLAAAVFSGASAYYSKESAQSAAASVAQSYAPALFLSCAIRRLPRWDTLQDAINVNLDAQVYVTLGVETDGRYYYPQLVTVGYICRLRNASNLSATNIHLAFRTYYFAGERLGILTWPPPSNRYYFTLAQFPAHPQIVSDPPVSLDLPPGGSASLAITNQTIVYEHIIPITTAERVRADLRGHSFSGVTST